LKAIIDEEELYPVYLLTTEIDEYNKDYVKDIPDDLYSRYTKNWAEFQKIQDELRELEQSG